MADASRFEQFLCPGSAELFNLVVLCNSGRKTAAEFSWNCLKRRQDCERLPRSRLP